MKKGKMTRKNKLILIFSIIAFLLLGISVPFIVDHFTSEEPPEEHTPLDPEFLEKPTDGTTPSDHSCLDNFRIAGGVLSLTDNFKTIQEGNALSETVLKNNQIVSAQRVVNKDKAYVTHTTKSSFVESAVERIYLEDKVLLRNGKFDKDQVVYNDGEVPFVYSYEYILQNIGWLPFDMTSYIINEDTIISSRVVESNYHYSMEFILDNTSSVSNTKREVRYNANAVSYPKYSQVKVTISLDESWKVLEIKTEDKYDITVKMGINFTVPVETHLVEKFYYDDCLLESLESHSYFSNFYEEEVDDNVIVEKEKRAIDYIFDVLFDVILKGATFNCEIATQDVTLEGKLDIKFDISNMSGNIIGLFDDFFFKYNKDLYISYLKHNYKFDENFLNEALTSLGLLMETSQEVMLVDEEPSQEGSLTNIFDNLELIKDGNNVTVKGNIDLEGKEVCFDFKFFEMEQGTILKSINMDIDGSKITLSITNKKIEYTESEYNDLSNSVWLIDELVKISKYQGYTLHIDHLLNDHPLDIEINIVDENTMLFTFAISDLNNSRSIEVYYFDEVYYLSLDNYLVEIYQEDIDLLIGYLEEYLQNDEAEEVSLVNEEVQEEQQDLSKILYEVIGVAEMVDGNIISIPLILSSLNENLQDCTVYLYNKDNTLNAELVEYGIYLSIDEFVSDIVLPSGKPIYDKSILEIVEEHVNNVQNIWDKESIQIDFTNVNIKGNSSSIGVDGQLKKNKEDYSLELDVTGNIKMKLKVTYLNNKYYLSFGEDRYSINLILSSKQMETFISYIEEIFDYFFQENDFDVSLEAFIGDLINEINKIINGDMDATVGEIVFEIVNILDSSYLEIDERNIIVEFDQTELQLYKLSENYMLIVENLIYKESTIEGEIYLKEKQNDITVDTTGFIDISEIFEDLEIPNPQN